MFWPLFQPERKFQYLQELVLVIILKNQYKLLQSNGNVNYLVYCRRPGPSDPTPWELWPIGWCWAREIHEPLTFVWRGESARPKSRYARNSFPMSVWLEVSTRRSWPRHSQKPTHKQMQQDKNSFNFWMGCNRIPPQLFLFVDYYWFVYLFFRFCQDKNNSQ